MPDNAYREQESKSLEFQGVEKKTSGAQTSQTRRTLRSPLFQNGLEYSKCRMNLKSYKQEIPF
jgi:hypothetical protein